MTSGKRLAMALGIGMIAAAGVGVGRAGAVRASSALLPAAAAAAARDVSRRPGRRIRRGRRRHHGEQLRQLRGRRRRPRVPHRRDDRTPGWRSCSRAGDWRARSKTAERSPTASAPGALQFWVNDVFWLKGMVGFGTVRFSYDDYYYYGGSVSESAFAVGGAAGFEIMQSHNFALDLQFRRRPHEPTTLAGRTTSPRWSASTGTDAGSCAPGPGDGIAGVRGGKPAARAGATAAAR